MLLYILLYISFRRPPPQASAPRGIMVTVGRGNYDVTIPLVVGAAKEMDIRGIFRYANW